MTAVLIMEYILSQKQNKNDLPKNGVVIKSIVSSNMADAVAKEYNIEIQDVLTGFKYIGEKIEEYESTGKYKYLFGFEESYGCLVGTHARDKDAIVAVMTLCEAATYYKSKGLTLWDQMINLYEKYGYYKEDIFSITLEGAEGVEKIQESMSKIRKEEIKKIGDYNVEKIRDYQKEEVKDLINGKIKATGLPKSNVLYYELVDDAWFCIRPSGTEPKIKFYIGIKGKNMNDAENKIKKLKENILELKII